MVRNSRGDRGFIPNNVLEPVEKEEQEAEPEEEEVSDNSGTPAVPFCIGSTPNTTTTPTVASQH